MRCLLCLCSLNSTFLCSFHLNLRVDSISQWSLSLHVQPNPFLNVWPFTPYKIWSLFLTSSCYHSDLGQQTCRESPLWLKETSLTAQSWFEMVTSGIFPRNQENYWVITGCMPTRTTFARDVSRQHFGNKAALSWLLGKFNSERWMLTMVGYN